MSKFSRRDSLICHFLKVVVRSDFQGIYNECFFRHLEERSKAAQCALRPSSETQGSRIYAGDVLDVDDVIDAVRHGHAEFVGGKFANFWAIAIDENGSSECENGTFSRAR